MQLADRCRSADRAAQEHVFRLFYSDFLKVCLRYAGDRQEADAMLSDAFFKIFTRIDSFKGTGHFAGWMKKIVVNTCLSHVRASRRETEIPHDGGSIAETAGAAASHNEALSRLGLQELTALIQKLPPVSRSVFNLFVFEGFSHREIAEQLSISEGTSHWHLSTARQWLKSKI